MFKPKGPYCQSCGMPLSKDKNGGGTEKDGSNRLMDKKKIVFDFIQKQKLAVIATVNSKNEPESAVLEFGQTDNLEIIFDTFQTSRKYKNLQQNKVVSLVIGWDKNITVQYKGLAEELNNEEREKYKHIYFTKNPDAKCWEEKEGIVYFIIKPLWIRYSDLNKDPWDIFEITL